MLRPYVTSSCYNHNSVYMVGHDYERIKPRMWKMVGNSHPTGANNLATFTFPHFIVYNIAE